MGFFDKLGAQLNNAARTAQQNVRNMSDTNSLKRDINNEKHNIQQKYQEIGQLYYEQYKDDPNAAYAEQIMSITNSSAKITQLEAEIQEVQARKAELVPVPDGSTPTAPAAPTVPAGGSMVCPQCGVTYDSTQTFCQNCGTRLTEAQPAPIPQPVPAEQPPVSTIPQPEIPASVPVPPPAATLNCPECGTVNESDSAFCINCGKKLN